jgi:hypothetical protein
VEGRLALHILRVDVRPLAQEVVHQLGGLHTGYLLVDQQRDVILCTSGSTLFSYSRLEPKNLTWYRLPQLSHYF